MLKFPTLVLCAWLSLPTAVLCVALVKEASAVLPIAVLLVPVTIADIAPTPNTLLSVPELINCPPATAKLVALFPPPRPALNPLMVISLLNVFPVCVVGRRASFIVPLDKLLAFSVVKPLPLPNIVPFTLRFNATPSPPWITTAPFVYAFDSLVSVNVLTPAILCAPPSLAPATVPVDKLLALRSVSPLPLPVNVLVPMLMLPNPLVILPLFNAPVPVILA